MTKYFLNPRDLRALGFRLRTDLAHRRLITKSRGAQGPQLRRDQLLDGHYLSQMKTYGQLRNRSG